jgi:hypothetical protein
VRKAAKSDASSDKGKGPKPVGPGTVLKPVIIGSTLLIVINVALAKVL